MQVSWIDPDSLGASLAALKPPAPKLGNLSHLEAGPQLDALAAILTARPASAAHSKTQAPAAAEPASPGTVPAAVLASLREKLDRLQASAAPAPLRVDPRAPLGRRLGDFAEWAGRLPEVGDVLVLDNDGHLLWGPPQPAELVLAALMAMNAGRRTGARDFCEPPQRITRTLAGSRQLSLLACPCLTGALQLAVVHGETLSGATEASLREALTSVVDAAP